MVLATILTIGGDPLGDSEFAGVGAQNKRDPCPNPINPVQRHLPVMGPDDGYMLQHSPEVGEFWASSSKLSLGHSFLSVVCTSSSTLPHPIRPSKARCVLSQLAVSISASGFLDNDLHAYQVLLAPPPTRGASGRTSGRRARDPIPPPPPAGGATPHG
eukprot:561995-Pyramimonas_sp.AAC.1